MANPSASIPGGTATVAESTHAVAVQVATDVERHSVAASTSAFGEASSSKRSAAPVGGVELKTMVRRIEKLEQQIKKLDEEECDLESMGTDESVYMQQDRLKRELIVMWHRYCKMVDQDPGIGPERPRRFALELSAELHHQQINNRLQRYAAGVEFPSRDDMARLMRKCMRHYHLAWSEAAQKRYVDVAFTALGHQAQRHRQRHFWSDHGSQLTDTVVSHIRKQKERQKQRQRRQRDDEDRLREDDEQDDEAAGNDDATAADDPLDAALDDPALHDKELEAKLLGNRQLGEARLDKLVDEFRAADNGIDDADEHNDDDDDDDGDADDNEHTSSGEEESDATGVSESVGDVTGVVEAVGDIAGVSESVGDVVVPPERAESVCEDSSDDMIYVYTTSSEDEAAKPDVGNGRGAAASGDGCGNGDGGDGGDILPPLVDTASSDVAAAKWRFDDAADGDGKFDALYGDPSDGDDAPVVLDDSSSEVDEPVAAGNGADADDSYNGGDNVVILTGTEFNLAATEAPREPRIPDLLPGWALGSQGTSPAAEPEKIPGPGAAAAGNGTPASLQCKSSPPNQCVATAPALPIQQRTATPAPSSRQATAAPTPSIQQQQAATSASAPSTQRRTAAPVLCAQQQTHAAAPFTQQKTTASTPPFQQHATASAPSIKQMSTTRIPPIQQQATAAMPSNQHQITASVPSTQSQPPAYFPSTQRQTTVAATPSVHPAAAVTPPRSAFRGLVSPVRAMPALKPVAGMKRTSQADRRDPAAKRVTTSSMEVLRRGGHGASALPSPRLPATQPLPVLLPLSVVPPPSSVLRQNSATSAGKPAAVQGAEGGDNGFPSSPKPLTFSAPPRSVLSGKSPSSPLPLSPQPQERKVAYIVID